jgi:uncharacterized protein YbaR (Trm112 family)
MISPELLKILRCPTTQQPLHEVDTPEPALVTADGKIRYPIRDGVPALLASEAVNL